MAIIFVQNEAKGYAMKPADIPEEIEYWDWGIKKLKDAIRQHKFLVISVG